MIDFEKIKRVIMQTIQPLGRFEYDEQKDNKVKGTDFVPEGTREDVSHTSPYGLSQNIPKKTFGYYLNLFGNILSPVSIANLDTKRPKAEAVGQVVLYCRNLDGTEYPVTLDLKPDGNLVVKASTKVSVEAPQIDVLGETVVKITSPDVQLGEGTLEKIVNGETFQTLFNTHTHGGNLGYPTTVPNQQMVASHLSNNVKAGK